DPFFAVAAFQGIERGGRMILRPLALHPGQGRPVFGRHLALIQLKTGSAKRPHNLLEIDSRIADGGGWIVQLMSDARGQLSQRGKLLALLVGAGGFANAIGQHADQRGPNAGSRSSISGKCDAAREAMTAGVMARTVNGTCFSREYGSMPVTWGARAEY